MKPLAKLGVGCAVIFVTCIGGVGVLVFRMANAKVNPSTDYAAQIEALTAKSQEDRASQPEKWAELKAVVERAVVIHDRVLKKYANEPLSDQPIKVIDPSILRGTEIPEHEQKTVPAAHELLEVLAAEDVFKDLAAFADNARFVRPLPRGRAMIAVPSLELGPPRQMARYCAARMRTALREGNDAAYIEAFAGLCVLARAEMHQATTIDRLVGIAILALGVGEVQQGNIEKPLSKNVLEACLKMLSDQTLMSPGHFALEGERLAVRDTIQWTFSDTGDGDGWFMPSAAGNLGFDGMPGVQKNSGANVMGILHAGRKETETLIDDHFEKLKIYAAAPRAARKVQTYQPDIAVEQLSNRHMILKLVLPALGKAVLTNDHAVLHIAGTRVMLAIELYMREHGSDGRGEPPATLADVATTLGGTVPLDPISAKPFGYRVLASGEDPWGRRYLLYSIGADGVDNGGTQALRASDRTVPLKLSGTGIEGLDFVINDPGENLKKTGTGGETPPAK